MSYCVIRTDLMSGTKQPADMVSLRFYTAATEGAPEEVSARAEVENGTIVELKGLIPGEREVYKAVPATSASPLDKCVVIANPEMDYEHHNMNLSDYINPKGKNLRGYVLRRGNIFSITKEGFQDASAPELNAELAVGTAGKLTNGKGFGQCIEIEDTGRYTYYAVKIGNIEHKA